MTHLKFDPLMKRQALHAARVNAQTLHERDDIEVQYIARAVEFDTL